MSPVYYQGFVDGAEDPVAVVNTWNTLPESAIDGDDGDGELSDPSVFDDASIDYTWSPRSSTDGGLSDGPSTDGETERRRAM